uniref:Uncharacterized protein n=1 Tax=Oryza punctata TaxID=4537 RepID=A0A0E0LI54_ORYPU
MEDWFTVTGAWKISMLRNWRIRKITRPSIGGTRPDGWKLPKRFCGLDHCVARKRGKNRSCAFVVGLLQDAESNIKLPSHKIQASKVLGKGGRIYRSGCSGR